MSIERLSHPYSCVQGAPSIYAVDTAIFRLRYFTRCMACTFCHDGCCDHGVDIDVENCDRLLALGEDFRSRIAASPNTWFSADPIQDVEFPSGRYVRTSVHRGKCIFHAAGRGCAIHAYALDKGIDYHTLKPLVSTLFPATFEHGVLVPSSEVADGSLVCAGSGPTVYEGAREELCYYFGPQFVGELDELQSLDT